MKNEIRIDRFTTAPGYAHVWLGSSIIATVAPNGDIVSRASHIPSWIVADIRKVMAK